jgi:hypothetical protein
MTARYALSCTRKECQNCIEIGIAVQGDGASRRIRLIDPRAGIYINFDDSRNKGKHGKRTAHLCLSKM